MTNLISLSALDASNPLAFLAALGTLRLAHLAAPQAGVRLGWARAGAAWLPYLHHAPCSAGDLPALLLAAPRPPADAFAALGKNLTVAPETFTAFAASAQQAARTESRSLADYAAAFACERLEDRNGRVQYTDFCFITGSGHQHFLGTAQALDLAVDPGRLAAALFGPWQREKKNSMRWDPADAAEYALQWGDPSADGASAVWGANWLAFHALPCFPVHPNGPRLRTTAIRRAPKTDPEFRWPVWDYPLDLDTAASLLARAELQEKEPNPAVLSALGITAAFRATRVRIGQGANYKVSFRPATALM